MEGKHGSFYFFLSFSAIKNTLKKIKSGTMMNINSNSLPSKLDMGAPFFKNGDPTTWTLLLFILKKAKPLNTVRNQYVITESISHGRGRK